MKHVKQVSVLLPSPIMGEVISLIRSLTGFEEVPSTSSYEALRGRIKGGTVIVYKSGSIVYDSSLEEVRRIIENTLYRLYKSDGVVVGSDEAGKGEALGPLVVAAVALNPRQAAFLQSVGVADSKIVPENRIPELARITRRNSLAYSILRISPLRLNEMFRRRDKYGNLNDILAEGHRKVLSRVLSKTPELPSKIIVDKFDSSKEGRRIRMIEGSIGVDIEAVAGGETYPAVAAASILARNSYLKWIRRNLSLEALSEIKSGNYSVIEPARRPCYFKLRYLKKDF
ncbi:MAG: hypothetical protein ACUVQ0_07070 [Thermoproteota archaeon]